MALAIGGYVACLYVQHGDMSHRIRGLDKGVYDGGWSEGYVAWVGGLAAWGICRIGPAPPGWGYVEYTTPNHPLWITLWITVSGVASGSRGAISGNQSRF